MTLTELQVGWRIFTRSAYLGWYTEDCEHYCSWASFTISNSHYIYNTTY